MVEYIDRDYVLKLLGVFNDRVHGDYHFMNGIETAKEIVEDAPSADVQPVKWIPVKSRPMDEEERKEWSEKIGYDIEYEDAVIYTSQLPDDGQEVLTCSRYGTIAIDKFFSDPDLGCYFEENGDMDGIIAWMPLPKPPKDGET